MVKYNVTYTLSENDIAHHDAIECAIVKVHDSFIAFYADLELKKLIKIFSNTCFKGAALIEDNTKGIRLTEGDTKSNIKPPPSTPKPKDPPAQKPQEDTKKEK